MSIETTNQDGIRFYGMGEERLKKDILAAKFAYINDPLVDLIDSSVLNGKELILSDWSEHTSHAEFRAAIIIDHAKKQITYSVAGTRVDQGTKRAIADLRDDVRLAIGFVPRKMKAAANLNKILIKYLAEDIKDYTFNFTGHSLGAIMADCAATDIALRMKHNGIDIREGQISTVTFDNPGAHTSVQEVCKAFNKKHPNSPKMDIDEVKSRCSFKAINNRDNFINTMDKQVGEKFTIVMDGQKPLNTFNMMCGWIARTTHSIPIVRSIAGFLSYGRLKSQVSDHSLENFKDVIVEQKGHLLSKSGKLTSLDEAITGFEPIEYDKETFDAIKEQALKDKYPVVKADQQFSMTNTKGERIEFSPNQILKANNSQNQGKQRKTSHADLVVLDVNPQEQGFTRKFTDMFKPKHKQLEFKIKTVEEVVAQLKGNSKSRSSR